MKRAGLPIQLLVALLTITLVRGPAHAMPAELLPTVVHAAGGPRLVVVALGLDKRARTQVGLLEAAGEEAAKRSGRFEVMPVVDAYEPAEARARAGREQDAAAKLKDGQKALDDLDNQKATEVFTAAHKALAGTDLSRTWDQYLQAVRMMAASHATGGENGPAKADMERLIAFDPGASFSPNFFPPDLLKFAEAAKKTAQASKGELNVKTRPEGARVWVDGVYRGLAPVSVSGLAPGKHWISAVMGGYGLTQLEAPLGDQTVDLKTIELSPAYTRAEDQVTKDPEGSGRDAALVALGKKLGADELLVFVSRKSTTGEQVEVIGLRLDTRDGHNFSYSTTTLRMGDDGAAATFAGSLLARDEARAGRDPVTHFKGGLSFTPKKIAAFSLFGFGALALGTGIVFGVSALNNANQFRITPQVQQVVSANLASTGRAFSVVADISYLLALASVVTGGILFFTDRGPVVAESSSSGGTQPDTRRDSGAGQPRQDDRRDDDRKKRDDDRAAEERRKTEEADRKAEDDKKAKAEDDKKTKADEKKSKKEREEEERRKKEEEKEEKRKAAEEEKKKKEDEKKAKAEEKKMSKKEREAEEKRKKEEEEKARRDEEEKARREAEEKKQRDAEEKKRIEDEKKKADEKKKTDDHDDLRNY